MNTSDMHSIEISSNDNNKYLKARNSQAKSNVTIAAIIGASIIAALIIIAAVGWAKANSSSSSPTVNYNADYAIGAPITLPDDGNYIKFTFLHMNDVYELLPLNDGQTG